MSKTTAIYKSLTVKELKRTGNTATIVLEIDNGARIDELLIAKKHGLIGLIVDSVLVPVKLDRITTRENKLATIYAQHKTLLDAGVSLDRIPDANLELQYDMDAPLFPDLVDPFVKGAKGSSEDADNDQSEDDLDEDSDSGIDLRSEAQRLADEQKAADLEMEKPKKRGARKGFNNGGEARA